MERTRIEVVPTGGPLGAEIRGVDLAAGTDPRTVREIIDAFEEHHVLIFRDQRITRERLPEVVARFGPVFEPPEDIAVFGTKKREAVVTVSNVTEDGLLGDGPLPSHSDHQFLEHPPRMTWLYAEEVPERTGETSWSNLYRAYDDLSDGLKRRVSRLRVWSRNPYGSGGSHRGITGRNQHYTDEPMPHSPHPLVFTHPDTGRRALFVNYATCGILGELSKWRARRLLRRLQRHVEQRRYYYTHRWRPGDLAVWDNRCTNHKRAAVDAAARRVMYRVQVTEPVPPAR